MTTYQLSIETIRQLAPLVRRIEQADRSLGDQLKRAAASVPLNINEGMYSRGKNRGARLTNAMASAKESVACLQTAEAFGYVKGSEMGTVLDDLDHVVAALWVMIHRPWR